MTHGSASYKLSVRDFRYNSGSKTEAMSVLSELYPDKTLSLREMERDGDAYNIVYRLARQGHIERADTHQFPPRYGITPSGRYRVLCHRLGVRFLCLCVLAEAYVMHGYQAENGSRIFYPLQGLIGMFDGVYSAKTIRNASSLLCANGMADNISSCIIQVRPETIRRLDRHGDTLQELHEWIIGMPGRLNRMAVNEYRHRRCDTAPDPD